MITSVVRWGETTGGQVVVPKHGEHGMPAEEEVGKGEKADKQVCGGAPPKEEVLVAAPPLHGKWDRTMSPHRFTAMGVR